MFRDTDPTSASSSSAVEQLEKNRDFLQLENWTVDGLPDAAITVADILPLIDDRSSLASGSRYVIRAILVGGEASNRMQRAGIIKMHVGANKTRMRVNSRFATPKSVDAQGDFGHFWLPEQ